METVESQAEASEGPEENCYSTSGVSGRLLQTFDCLEEDELLRLEAVERDPLIKDLLLNWTLKTIDG